MNEQRATLIREYSPMAAIIAGVLMFQPVVTAASSAWHATGTALSSMSAVSQARKACRKNETTPAGVAACLMERDPASWKVSLGSYHNPLLKHPKLKLRVFVNPDNAYVGLDTVDGWDAIEIESGAEEDARIANAARPILDEARAKTNRKAMGY